MIDSDNILALQAVGRALHRTRRGNYSTVDVWHLDEAERFVEHLRTLGFQVEPRETREADDDPED